MELIRITKSNKPKMVIKGKKRKKITIDLGA